MTESALTIPARGATGDFNYVCNSGVMPLAEAAITLA